ncbi:MAG TPA: ATP-binding protein [Stellaceae bacterium]|nr:ATP-binding protein [Stellaceae bacterium]
MQPSPRLARIWRAPRWLPAARSLRAYVVVLVLACIIPMVVFSAFAVLRYASAQREANDRQILNTARALSAAMDVELKTAESSLSALGTSPALRSRNIGEFFEQARQVAAQRHAWIILTDPSGREFFNTQRGLETETRYVKSSDLAVLAASTCSTQVSGVFYGNKVDRLQVSIYVPVVEKDEVPFVLMMNYDVIELNHVLLEQDLPMSWWVAVVDRDNRIILRNRDLARYVGKPAGSPLLEQMARASEGIFLGTTLEGVEVTAAFTKSAYTGWTLSVGVPLTETAGALWSSLLGIGFSAAAMLALGLLFAAAVGRRMRGALRHLSSAALALGHGAMVSPARAGLAEVDDVLSALGTASDLLHQQSRQRDQAERALKQSEQRFRDIAETAADWIWETDREHRFSYFSGSEERATGMTASQIIGLTRWKYAGGDIEADEHWRQHKADLDARRLFRDFRYAVRLGDGRTVHYVINGKPVFDETGAFVGYRGIATNQTDVVEARERAERAETLLRDAVDSMSEGFLIYDKDDRLVMLNERYKSCYPAPHPDLEPGFTFEELMRRGIAAGRFAHAGDPEKMLAERMRRHQEAGGAFEQQLTDGRWLLITDRRMRNGGIAGLRIDITALKQAQSALRVSEESLGRTREHLALAQRMAEVGSLIRDLKTGEIEWSDELYRIYGLNPDADPPRFETLLDLVHPDDRQAVIADRDVVLRGGAQALQEYRIIRPDGETRLLHRTSKILVGEGEQPTHLLVIFRDITEAREAETHRRTLEDQLHHSQKLESLGTLAGGIAHDLNNTLVPVIAMAKLGLKRIEQQSPTRQYFELIHQAGVRARDLVKQVLAFSRKDSADRQPFRVDEVVEEALAMLRPTMPATIALERVIELVPPILGDATQLHQITVNLVTNAVHAIGMSHGTITVTVSVLPGARPGEHGLVRLSVRDTGCGMDEATQKRIFDPFFTTKAVGEGSGLGLSVVHGIVVGHGGTIRVESRPDHGACFIIELPLADEPAALPEALSA